MDNRNLQENLSEKVVRINYTGFTGILCLSALLLEYFLCQTSDTGLNVLFSSSTLGLLILGAGVSLLIAFPIQDIVISFAVVKRFLLGKFSLLEIKEIEMAIRTLKYLIVENWILGLIAGLLRLIICYPLYLVTVSLNELALIFALPIFYSLVLFGAFYYPIYCGLNRHLLFKKEKGNIEGIEDQFSFLGSIVVLVILIAGMILVVKTGFKNIFPK